jgi:uncharacterized RDD family membrane protein YckC
MARPADPAISTGALSGLDELASLDLLLLPEALVTGEAVELELRATSFAPRALAVVLDVVISLALLLGMIMGLAILSPGDASLAAALSLTITVLCLVGYPVFCETVTRGRSVGKLAAGLRVVRDDGGPVRFRQSLVRGLLGVVEIYMLPFIALLASLTSRRAKRLGDQLAGTFVIRIRVPHSASAPPRMPPWLAGWAARTDLGRIPDPLAAAARGFLLRAPMLHPHARDSLAQHLAGDLARYVAPPPPPGTLPEDFMAAVLAERRARDLVRLAAEQYRRQRREADRHAAPVLSAAGTSLLGDQPAPS